MRRKTVVRLALNETSKHDSDHAYLHAAPDGVRPIALEERAQFMDSEGSEARLLLRLKGLMEQMIESDRVFLMECARRPASR